MYEYVALLRGVNVSGKTLSMARVVELFGSLGLADARSYIQSGNVLFNPGTTRRAGLEQQLQREIRERLSFELTVILRTHQELRSVSEGNPFAGRSGTDTKSLYVTFLAERASDVDLAKLPPLQSPTDEYRPAGTEIYLYCPGGYGKTAYSNAFFEKHLGIPATTRNWSRLLELAESSRRQPQERPQS
jgi:uncharacterized protein (DUF1697 family)